MAITITLKLGAEGDQVRNLQHDLASLGYLLKGTGYFGGATDTAVSDFQRAHGLADDGVVGEQTARALAAALADPDAMPPAAKAATTLATSRPLWVIEALKYVGIHEGAGPTDNPAIIEWAKEEGGSIAKAYTHDAIPWCSLFVNHVMTKCGIKGTETLWALDWAGKWPSVKLNGATVGAVCPISRPGGGHVFILLGRDARGNYVGVGGNQSDAVNIRAFPPARINHGFWWPSGVTPPLNVGPSTLPTLNANGVPVSRIEA